MPDADPNPVLQALHLRLQPLFDQYESLEYLIRPPGCGCLYPPRVRGPDLEADKQPAAKTVPRSLSSLFRTFFVGL